VLERFVAKRIARRAWPLDGSEADLAEARAAAGEVLARFEREGRVGDPAVWTARRDAILARLDRIVSAEALIRDGLTPAAVEHRFGGGAPEPALSLAWDGETVRLKGRVDRIDVGPDRLLVIDYKNARDRARYAGELDADAFGEASFQLPTYLLAAARAFPGRARLEGTYALLRRATRLDPLAIAADDPRLAGGGEPAPDGPPPFAAAAVGVVRRIRDGAFPIASRTCEGCPHGAVCRFEGAAARSAEEAP
jgi:hypothetical protein